LAAIAAFLLLVPDRDPDRVGREDPNLVEGGGFAFEVWARWDSWWFVEIAKNGYGFESDAAAFYPLYPASLAAVGWAVGGNYVLAGILVSLAAGAAAFVLLYGLAQSLVGDEAAWRSLLFLALFPTSFFLSAVYSEALFLLLAVATFVFAERRQLLAAGAAAGLALLTRPTGIALLPALAIFAWRQPSRLRGLASLAVAPALFAIYPLVLERQTGDAWRFLHVEGSWYRETPLLGPLEGLYRGAQAAWAGARQLLQGTDERWFWVEEGADRVAILNLELFALLVVFVLLTIVAWRRLGAPYGAFAAASLVLPLSAPTDTYPLLSLSRFGLVIFPLFVALGLLVATTRRAALLVGLSALLLGIHLTQWVLWRWVA
jgi:hypothetical protein